MSGSREREASDWWDGQWGRATGRQSGVQGRECMLARIEQFTYVASRGRGAVGQGTQGDIGPLRHGDMANWAMAVPVGRP
jgi:hypothetical protein